jgi:hypothetical protein
MSSKNSLRFLLAALSSLAFVAIHTSVMLVDFDGQEQTSYLQYAVAYGAQLFACLLTLGERISDFPPSMQLKTVFRCADG